VNGVPLGERLDGFNTTPEGGVINHGGLHADYITVARQCWWAVMFGALGRQPVPEAFLLNGRRVWRALTQVQWPDTGTIYQPDGTIRYPDLHDWGQKQFPFYAATDAVADLLRLDVDPSSAKRDEPTALAWMERHLYNTVELQRRHADGHTYERGEQLYPAPEQLAGHLIAYTWAARYASRNLPPAVVTSDLIPEPSTAG